MYRALIPLLTVLLVGCAGGTSIASYDSSNDQTLYQTGTIRVAQAATESFASQTSIVMQAVAGCGGKECSPEEVSLIFSLEGTSNLRLSAPTLTVNTEENQWTWRDEKAEYSGGKIGRTEGRLLKVTIPMSDLAELAHASSLTGALGEKSLNLKGAQSELQEFVAAAQGGAVAERLHWQLTVWSASHPA